LALTSRSTASCRCSGARWAYRWTIAIDRQPPRSCTLRRSTPAMTSRDANVWRLQCQVSPSSPLAFFPAVMRAVCRLRNRQAEGLRRLELT